MFKHLRSLVLSALVITGLVAGAGLWPATSARQIVINSTALNGAVSATQTFITVDSASAVTVGDLAFVDKEFMRVTAISGSRLEVRRGQEGSAAVAHADDAVIFIDSSEYFERRSSLAGPCTAASEYALPRIVIPSGRVFDCANGQWAERLKQTAYYDGAAVFIGKTGARDNFDQGYLVMQDDGTAKSVTDDEDNFVYGSPLGAIEYREELTKTTSSWVTSAGRLDISADDTTDDEGVEILFGVGELDGSYFVAGTTGACISASITITDISGTDQVQLGFRDNAAFVDAAAYAGYTIWNTVGVNNVDGSIMSSQEVSEATDTDDSGVNWADGETRVLKVCVSAAGVPTAYYTDAVTLNSEAEQRPKFKPITMTETGSTLTAGQAMVPFFSYLAAGTDGPDVFLNWVQLEPFK